MYIKIELINKNSGCRIIEHKEMTTEQYIEFCDEVKYFLDERLGKLNE